MFSFIQLTGATSGYSTTSNQYSQNNMGNDQSSAAAQAADAHGSDHVGFRVLGIQENSPASVVGFVSFFDFILSANGIRLDTKDSTFMELIARSEDKPMQLSVYNIKSQTTRDPEDLYDEIIDHLDQPFQCYVYKYVAIYVDSLDRVASQCMMDASARTDQVRLVRITPHDRWGGEGYLGAEVGHGYLHRLPASVHSTVGESVGFVSISNHAKAATDYFGM
ncbi:hypothetical protein DYB32_003721 [Aphanomyces invadans]|uniref:PDZ GRASP-type domain-containing protein n=1 Tax=Aphanomyces invadans TaxID=157072 RepID=A0A418AZN6_9STRA|nr:hypothetical protein DYB32_003721 [Aphanomyces invadans]